VVFVYFANPVLASVVCVRFIGIDAFRQLGHEQLVAWEQDVRIPPQLLEGPVLGRVPELAKALETAKSDPVS
jgi:hypothetical protein